jgi:colanic acid/amylovoran biosynthesis protein
MGVKAPCYQTSDPAFTLNPCSPERVQEIVLHEGVTLKGKPLIGFSVSKTATRWGEGNYKKFVQSIAQAIDKMSGHYQNSQFIFIPHVTYRNDPENDDRIAGREIYHNVSRKDKVCLIEGDYTCEESKGIIGLCDLFIGARTHATIASVSQRIPTIALAYSSKAFGIMEDALGDKRCVMDINEITAERLTAVAQSLLSEKEEIALQIAERLKEIQNASMRNGELAKGLFS